MFQRILVPFDLSPPARAALLFAKRLAGARGAIHLAFALESSVPLAYGGMVLIEDVKAQLERRLAQAARAARGSSGLRVTTSIASGSAWRTILAEADRLRADSIIMGSHGWKGGMRLVLGSVAERIVREARVPVCVVRQGTPPGRGKLRRVGLAMELEGRASRAAGVAKAIAKEHGATLDLLHVMREEDFGWLGAIGGGRGTDAARAAEELQIRRLERLQRAGSRLGGAEVRVLESISVGDVPKSLAAKARTLRLDLLVMGTHGRKGLQRLLFGSVAVETIRQATCPLLIVNETAPARPARRKPARGAAGAGRRKPAAKQRRTSRR
jgi:nucleotide-binding universal stress UspA family protein